MGSLFFLWIEGLLEKESVGSDGSSESEMLSEEEEEEEPNAKKDKTETQRESQINHSINR